MAKKNKKRECRRKRKRGMNECTNDEKKGYCVTIAHHFKTLIKINSKKIFEKIKRFYNSIENSN
jgi:hypothetical protein